MTSVVGKCTYTHLSRTTAPQCNPVGPQCFIFVHNLCHPNANSATCTAGSAMVPAEIGAIISHQTNLIAALLLTMWSSIQNVCVADVCNLVDTDATSLVVRAGPSIVQGLLAALLAVSAVSRVHKVCSIFIELTGIQHSEGRSAADAIVDWLHAAIQQLPLGEMTKFCTLLVSLLYCFKVQQCIVPYNTCDIIQPFKQAHVLLQAHSGPVRRQAF